ncbi:MAG TPA: hypothetical protein VGP72_05090 [Planctomycetota bacterium]|jgi:hypothetical protein
MADPYNEPRDPYRDDEARTSAGAGWWWLWFLALILLVFGFGGWGWWGGGMKTPGTYQPGVGAPVVIQDNRQDLETLVGRNATLEGNVGETNGDNAFILSGVGPTGKDQVLVVTRQPINQEPINVSAGEQNVKVKGAVLKYDKDRLEKNLKITLNDDYKGKTVVVADSVERLVPAKDETQSETEK